mgnify:CR=1 FL=1
MLIYARKVHAVKQQLIEQDNSLARHKHKLTDLAKTQLAINGTFIPKNYLGYDSYNYKYTREYHEEQLKKQSEVIDEMLDED